MTEAGAQVAVLGMKGQMVRDRLTPVGLGYPQVVRLAAFAALALYGAARWSTMLSGGTHGRIVGLVGLALLLAAGRPLLARRSRLLAALLTTLILLAGFPVAGVPLDWVVHLRIAVIANAIGAGLSALPQVLVPYNGLNEWVRLDIVLGAGVLLFDAALLLAFAPRQMEDMRRAGVALPLVALVAVPSTLAHPRFPYLDGLILFLLLAAFALGDRVSSRAATSAIGLCLVTAIAAMLVAPSLAGHRPWLDYWSFAGRFAPKTVDTFDWSQTYGPLNWPHRGSTVLEVKAAQSEYWKAEDLDVFDGRGWTQGFVPQQASTPAPSRQALTRWTQTIEVTLDGMKTNTLIGAGVSYRPGHVSQPVVPGFSAGTWTTANGTNLEPGDTYSLRVYDPQPTAAQLSAAGANYGTLPEGYRTMILSARAVPGAPASTQIAFPPFHSHQPLREVIGPLIGLRSATSIVETSAYGGAYRLAQRLAGGAGTPYAFAIAVERFLGRGYAYDQNPPVRAYPLESFLFRDKRGYCQQFAGAMALLLRMGGVPARVAVGFTPGHRNAATHRWVVSDLDAHAWVEAWFPAYGWVRFDPTPPADPALGGISAAASGLAGGSAGAAARAGKRTSRAASLGSHVRGSSQVTPGSGVSAGAWAAIATAGLLGLALLLVATRPLSSADALVAELERALARSGRPLSTAATLAGLEHRMRTSPGASQYIQALRVARFGGRELTPTPAQRRALRRELAFGLGPLGMIRGLWALPPRRRRPGRATHTTGVPDA